MGKGLNFEFYCITDQASARGRSDLVVAEGLLKGGATVLQYRAKKVFAAEQWAMAQALRKLTRAYGVPLVINDRVDLALACQADGVHMGQDDLPVSVVRKLAGKKLFLGISTHSPAQAAKAQAEGADYIGFGPIYATQTKENNVPPVGLANLKKALSKTKIPVVAIGGIKERHVAELARAGAQNIAVVTALTGAAQIAKTTQAFKALWQQAKQAVEEK